MKFQKTALATLVLASLTSTAALAQAADTKPTQEQLEGQVRNNTHWIVDATRSFGEIKEWGTKLEKTVYGDKTAQAEPTASDDEKKQAEKNKLGLVGLVDLIGTGVTKGFTETKDKLDELDTAVKGKAEAADLAALQGEVAKKASQADHDKLAQSHDGLIKNVNDINATVKFLRDNIPTEFDKKADKTDLEAKADKADYEKLAESHDGLIKNVNGINEVVKALKDTVPAEIDKKANKDDVKTAFTEMTKVIDEGLNAKADQTALDALSKAVDKKADAAALDAKADKAEFDSVASAVKENTDGIVAWTKWTTEQVTALSEHADGISAHANARIDEVKEALRKTDINLHNAINTKASQATFKAFADNTQAAVDQLTAGVNTNIENIGKIGNEVLNLKDKATAAEQKLDNVEFKVDGVTELAKANKEALTKVYTKEETDAKFALKADATDVSGNTAKIATNTASIAANAANIATNANNIAANTARINDLDKDLKRGLASQAALAGLFQPYNVGKVNVTAALGGYKSETAVAVGAGYRVTEKFAAKAGFTLGSGSSAYNVSVNYEF